MPGAKAPAPANWLSNPSVPQNHQLDVADHTLLGPSPGSGCSQVILMLDSLEFTI